MFFCCSRSDRTGHRHKTEFGDTKIPLVADIPSLHINPHTTFNPLSFQSDPMSPFYNREIAGGGSRVDVERLLVGTLVLEEFVKEVLSISLVKNELYGLME